jgi:cytochrome c556
MRRTVLRTVLGAAILLAPGLAIAGISLSATMESWNRDRHKIDAMLAGQTPYDEALLRQDLQSYMERSSLLARDVRGGSAEARDFASRFEALANDSRSALGAIGQSSALRVSFNRMVGDCQSCHAVYNN